MKISKFSKYLSNIYSLSDLDKLKHLNNNIGNLQGASETKLVPNPTN